MFGDGVDGEVQPPERPRVIDTRLLGKPRVYSNNRADWPGFKFVTKSYVGAVSARTLSRMEMAESATAPVPLNVMNEEERQDARTLNFILSQILSGPSLQLLMNCETGNGLEAWRLLVRSEEPSSGSAQVAHLTVLLRTTFTGKLESYEEELQRQRFER